MLVGDTLWLDFNFPDSLRDHLTNKRYRVRPQDYPWVTYFAIEQLQGIGNLPTGVANTFQAVAKRGRISIGGSTTGVITFDYDGSSYRGRFGLIPTQKGIVTISLVASPPGGTSGLRDIPLPFIKLPSPATGPAPRAVLDYMLYSINEGKANNHDLFSLHTRAFANDPDVVPFGRIYELESRFTVEVR